MKNHNIDYLDMLRNSEVILDKYEIKEELGYLAEEISDKLHYRNPIIITVMNGGMRFSSDLQKKLKFPFDTGYIHTARYNEKNNTPNDNVRIKSVWIPDSADIENRPILFVDDIIDSGKTVHYLYNKFKNPTNEVYITSMFCRASYYPSKLVQNLFDKNLAFLGLSIDTEKFVFGYGMDYKGQWRGLNEVRAMLN